MITKPLLEPITQVSFKGQCLVIFIVHKRISINLTPPHPRYRGSYMSAHVLLNLLNELGKRDKMRGLPSI